MGTPQVSLSYNVSELAKFFHSFPHFDIQFSPISSVFDPDSKEYLQSLLLIAAVPVAWMLLWILIYMVYFCYFCVTCRKQRIEKTRKSVRPTKWCSFVFSMLTILVLTVSIFGNEVVDYSLKTANSDLNNIRNGTDKAVLQSAVILRAIDSLNNETAAYLKEQFQKHRTLDEIDRPAMLGNSVILHDALSGASGLFRTGLQQPVTQLEIDNSQFSSLLSDYEMYRRIATHAVAGFLMMATALALCAVGSKKKGFILTCVAISIFNLMLVWVAAGFYAGLAVATADFCVDPTGYVIDSNGVSADEQASMRYYLECQPAVNPLYKVVVDVQNDLDDADNAFSAMLKKEDVLQAEIVQNITDARTVLTTVKEQLLRFSSATDCYSSHKNYMSAVNNICHTSLVGETAILGSFTLAGTFIIILVFLLHAVARFNGTRKTRKPSALNVTPQPVTRRRRRAYHEVDSQDIDYQSRGEHNRSDNPLYYRFSQISTTEDNTRVAAASPSTSAAVQPTAPPRSSPPPAYHNHKDFYSTYGNNGTLDSNTRVPAGSNDLNRNSNTFRT